KGLAGGACASRELTLIGTDGFRCRLAAAVPEPLAGSARRTRADRLAIGAAGEALADAGLGARDRAAAALVVGAVGGGMLEAEAWYWRHARDGTRPASLSAVRAMLPSAHAETPASRFRLGGPGHTVATAGRARGARVYATLAGHGMTTDAFHVTAPEPEGDGMVRAMSAALARAGAAPREVQYANAHGTGTPQNDRIEARALARVFGEGGLL